MSRRPARVPAPRRFVSGEGAEIVLRESVGLGGEGEVFATADDGVLAKIYAAPDEGRAEKLLSMLPMLGRMDAFAAWPRDVVRDAATGAVVGFTMRRAAGRHDIHDLYNVKSRRRHFPKADWRFLVHVAANVSRAFAAAHGAGCVIGDVNQGGLRVAPDGTVTLIDCDSMQVAGADGRVHRCGVGVDTFTPPELHGARFDQVDRTTEHDAFGLAVLVFQTLFLGRHPFIGVFSGDGDMDPGRAVREHRYAFGRDAARFSMRPPPGSVAPGTAGPEIAELFERAFSPAAGRSGRPSARTWLEALQRLEASLARCGADDAHWHVSGQDCPWCRLEAASGVQLFPVVVRRLAESLFDMAGFRAALAEFAPPGRLPRIHAPEVGPTPGIGRGVRRARALGGAGALAILAAAAWFWSGWIALCAVAWLVLAKALRRRLSGHKEYARRLRVAALAYEQAEAEWKRLGSARPYDERRAEVEARCREWENVAVEHERRMRRLTSNLEVDQRARFLDRFPIADAGVEGIGPHRVQALESFGISTASDIEEAAVLAVPGFGPKRYEALARWRRSVEKGFRYEPKAGVDPRDVARVEAETLRRRSGIEAELLSGLGELRMLSRRIADSRSGLRPVMEARLRDLEQAKADLAAVS